MSNNERVLLTEQGLHALQEELERLRKVERPRISERIREAKEGGDISESGEYDEAKRQQSFVEGRIRELESVLGRAEQIDPSQVGSDTVTFGSKVTVEMGGRRETYVVVNKAESGRSKNGEIRVSSESPVGGKLLGRKVGDDVPVTTPGGSLTMKVVSIE